VVLLDWALRGLSGSTVFRKLKELNPDVKVIGITGYLHPSVRETMLQEGVREFIQKPCSPAQIYERVWEAARPLG
jgi:CheY-like chemotaxis protein